MSSVQTCLDSAPSSDELATEIRHELAEAGSVLVLMRNYMRELVGKSDNEAGPLLKFRRLFELGRVPSIPSGHHYGVTLGLRTGDLPGPLAPFGNFLGFVWGVAIGQTCPWVGKSFAPMAAAERARVTDAIPDELPVARGINHFNEIQGAAINRAGNALLAAMWPLVTVSAADRTQWGHERDGGNFIAHRAHSVCASTPREVIRLDYRHAKLDNHLPLPWLIDEIVEIADGIYLGQLLFATKHLAQRYDPERDPGHYQYQHFGYFLLFDSSYDEEARELFPHLEIPPPPAVTHDKFSTLTLDGAAIVDPALLAELRRDLSAAGTVLDLLRNYSDELQRRPVTDSPIFAKLQTLFLAGIAPERMSGFWYGALVSWQSQGLLAAFDVNKLNIAWQLCRPFSPWTGKRFDPISRERLAELSDGWETHPESTQLCSNTVVFRTLRERAVRGMMKAMHLWVEDASEPERREHGYDAKTFFFIGKPAPSVAAENHGKLVYQFNYRWKALRNPPPDFLCMDELVQIAEGLYLGQVYYSTKPLVPWHPETAPSEYGYQLFEYFLLMDEQWHARRLRMGFDLENV